MQIYCEDEEKKSMAASLGGKQVLKAHVPEKKGRISG
jgi:hypothetical protein